MRVAVDQDKCCGAGKCVLLAPEVFDQREDDGVVVLLDEALPSGCTARSARPPTSAPPPPSG